MKRCFVPHQFGAATQQVVNQANVILEEYAAKGYDLTLRQLYYQFVARGLMENKQRNYKRLGDLIDKARLAGLVDWDHIEDRTRNLKGRSSWTTPADMISSAYYSYHRDRWADQPVRVELWVEKEALVGIFAQVCRKWDVNFFACRGYVSQSEMYRAAQRYIRYNRDGQRVVILHFGDHDPSGVDMTRDIRDRLAMFGAEVEVRRMALNMDQVRRFDPPPNPAKATDARFEAYVAEHGSESWELDALDPETLTKLVEDSVCNERTPRKWVDTVKREQRERALLKVASDEWPNMEDWLELKYAADIDEATEYLADRSDYKEECL